MILREALGEVLATDRKSGPALDRFDAPAVQPAKAAAWFALFYRHVDSRQNGRSTALALRFALFQLVTADTNRFVGALVE
jgi:hypothetical protein